MKVSQQRQQGTQTHIRYWSGTHNSAYCSTLYNVFTDVQTYRFDIELLSTGVLLYLVLCQGQVDALFYHVLCYLP
jgi:hypothetical protein